MPVTREAVETFLYREAALLDDWKLQEWLGLFAKDGQYLVPPMDVRDQDPELALHLVDDDYGRLQSRVKQLLSGKAYSENPVSRTRRTVSNVLFEAQGGSIRVQANFIVHRFRHERIDAYIGRYDHTLVEEGGELRFRKARGKGIALEHKALSVRLRSGGERLQPDPHRPRRTLKNLFQEAGVTKTAFRLYSAPTQRKATAQFNETALHFATRLMEEEGWYYFFEHTEDSHTLVVTNDNNGFYTIPNATLRLGVGTTADMLVEYRKPEQFAPGKVTVKDYDHDSPDKNLKMEQNTILKHGGTAQRPVFHWPALTRDTAVAKNRARWRMEAAEAAVSLIGAGGDNAGLIAGGKFRLRTDAGAFDKQVQRVAVARAHVERLTRSLGSVPVRRPVANTIGKRIVSSSGVSRAMSRRRSSPYSRMPSRWPRNSTVVTPTWAAPRRSSSSRRAPRRRWRSAHASASRRRTRRPRPHASQPQRPQRRVAAPRRAARRCSQRCAK